MTWRQHYTLNFDAGMDKSLYEFQNLNQKIFFPNFFRCTCGECVSQPSTAESLCCHEVDLVDRQREELDLMCITKHPGFVGNCINQYVVETSFYEFLANYGHVGDDEPVHE